MSSSGFEDNSSALDTTYFYYIGVYNSSTEVKSRTVSGKTYNNWCMKDDTSLDGKVDRCGNATTGTSFTNWCGGADINKDGKVNSSEGSTNSLWNGCGVIAGACPNYTSGNYSRCSGFVIHIGFH